MRKGKWIALAAVGLMLAGGGAVWANDTVRLGGPKAQADITGGTDTELVRHRGSYYRGGYGGGYNRSGYGGGYYGGGYGSRYYSPYSYGGYNSRSYYGPSYYSNSYYYPRSYYSQSYYTPYYSSYYYPCAGETAPTVALQSTSYSTMLPPPQGYTPPPVRNVQPMPPAVDGSFRYDGEPRNTEPMPTPTPGNVDPVKGPQRLVPLDGKLVSFGGMSPIPTPRNIVGSTARVSYPAYGEEPIAPVRRK